MKQIIQAGIVVIITLLSSGAISAQTASATQTASSQASTPVSAPAVTTSVATTATSEQAATTSVATTPSSAPQPSTSSLQTPSSKGQTASSGAAVTTSKDSKALIDSTVQTKASTNTLILLQEEEVKKATRKLEELRQLVVDGLIARVEFEKEERSLDALKRALEQTRQQIVDADRLVAEIKAADERAKSQTALAKTFALQPLKPTNSLVRPTILRFGGSSSFALGRLHEVQSFFTSTFGRSLPTSAIGQSATHNSLRYDHSNAVDVALHPDSFEGRTLISYLQSKGIPFLAFRAAVPGVATGPHIHIGNPSHRI